MHASSTRLLPFVLCALPFGCTFARTESTAAETPVHFTVGQDRALAKDDKAEGEFVADGKRTVLRHAYAVLDKAWNEDAPTLKLRLSDVPLTTREHTRLGDMADRGEVRYLEARLDDKGGLASVHLCNQDVKATCVKTVEFGDRKTKLELDLREGHQLRGRLYTSGPKSFMKVPYSFSVVFKATLWETSSAHLGTKPDGSFGVPSGRAVGAVAYGAESMTLAHAYARPHDSYTQVVLTPKPLPASVLAQESSLSQAFHGSELPGLLLEFRKDGRLAGSDWTKGPGFSCSDPGPGVRFAVAAGGPQTIAGTAHTLVPEQCGDSPYEFKVSFQASFEPSH